MDRFRYTPALRRAAFLMSAAVIAPLLAASSARALTFHSIDYPGATLTEALGINSRDQIVGAYSGTDTLAHAFVLTGGTFKVFDYPNADNTTAFAINDQGQIVGTQDVNGSFQGYLLSGNTFTPIEYPSASFTIPQGINNRGQIVGGWVDASFVPHGFLLEDGVFTSIDVPGAVATAGDGIGINDRGQIVGDYKNSDGAPQGFLLDHGEFTTIDYPDAASSEARAINDSRQIVGSQDAANAGSFQGYLRDSFLGRGIYTTVVFPGSTSTQPQGINGAGRIVGSYFDEKNAQHGFVTGDPRSAATRRLPTLLVRPAP